MSAPNLVLDNADLISNLRGEGGNAGDIVLTADKLLMDNFADLENQSFGKGNGGNVVLRARDIRLLGNTEITTRLKDDAEGNAGDVLVEAQRLEMRQESRIQTETTGKGNAGNVTLNVPGEIILQERSEIDVRNADLSFQPSFVFIRGTGDSGQIVVNGGNMILDNSPLLAQVLGTGTGKGISVNLTGDLLIDGLKTASGFFTGARQNALAPAGEGAGPLSVRARNLEMQGGSARIQGGTIGDARGGTVTVNVENNLKLTSNARILSSADAGAKQDASDMVITAKRIELLDRAIFESATRADVNSGKITITTEELRLDDQGQIVASTTEKGNAATIDITATRSLEVLKDSVIYSGVDGGTGNGADINITAGDVILREGGRIEARTEGTLPNLIASSIEGLSYDEVIQRSNPVAYWKLDDTDGTVSDSGRQGRFSGSTEGGTVGSSTDSVSGRAGRFDGDGPGGVIRIDPDLDLEKTAFFIEAWVKLDPNASGSGTIVSVIDESSDRPGFSSRVNSEGANIVVLDSGGSFRANAIPNDGQWHHVVTRIGGGDLNPDGSTQVTITDYVNGKQIQGGAGGSLRLENETLRIGGWKGPDSLPFQGLIDEVAIYKGDELPRSGILPIEKHYIAGQLSLNQDLQVEVSGEAIAGNININANNIDIAGASLTPLEDLRTRGKDFRGISSGIFAGSETEFSGQSATITLNVADSLKLDDSGVISVLTNSLSDAGSVDITANTVSLNGGGQILATSSNLGEAGTVNITANRIRVQGFDPNYQARFDSVADPSLRIDVAGPRSSINATSEFGTDGNIILNPNELLLVQNQGQVLASANNAGGNITINSKNGFVLADDTSSIVATGTLDIATQDFSNVDLSQQSIEPSQSTTITRQCSPKNLGQNTFVQSGRGGLPANPSDPLRSGFRSGSWIDLNDTTLNAEVSITPNPTIPNPTPPNPSPPKPTHKIIQTENYSHTEKEHTEKTKHTTNEILEAKTWTTNANGEAQLVAAAPVTAKSLTCSNNKG